MKFEYGTITFFPRENTCYIIFEDFRVIDLDNPNPSALNVRYNHCHLTHEYANASTTEIIIP